MKKLIKQEFNKGDYITPDRLEEELGYIPTGLHLMSVCQALDKIHNGMTIVCENGGIRFLTDSEATNYNHIYFGRHLFALSRRNKKMLSVDQSNLSNDEKGGHLRKLEIQSFVLVGIKDSLRSHLPPKPYSSDIKKLF